MKQRRKKSRAETVRTAELRRARQLGAYHARMEDAREYLGNRCARCDCTESLEFDHIDPTTKVRALTELWSQPKLFWDELRFKMQLLCHDCHREKTADERTRRVEIARAKALYLAGLERAPFEDDAPANDTAPEPANDDGDTEAGAA